jgi:hypothetical protein
LTHALIGHTGFVGSTLKRQTRFDALFRSTDISRIDGQRFDTVVCAAAPAMKWAANADPESDARAIDGLIGHLRTLSCGRFVLVSTVDVYRDPQLVDETTGAPLEGLQPYGFNRRRLEMFVTEHFEQVLVVRLPGLVGPGLRKNVVFDLLHENNLDAVDSRGIFQFYPMVNLWWDIQTALAAGLNLVHFTAEPLDVATLAREGFGREFDHQLDRPVSRYDFRTSHAATFGGGGDYQYSVRDTLQAVRSYAQSAGAAVQDEA